MLNNVRSTPNSGHSESADVSWGGLRRVSLWWNREWSLGRQPCWTARMRALWRAMRVFLIALSLVGISVVGGTLAKRLTYRRIGGREARS